MCVFDHIEFNGHEQVVFAHDEATGLKAIIAVRNTALGAAVGGCRMYPYTSDDAALTDALRLSRGMTYKSAMAGLPLGGGKSVIIGDPRHEKTPELMQAMGRAVERLAGAYVVAEDSGTTPADMREMAKFSSHVAGLEDNAHGGDPSPATAWGVFLSIKTGAKHQFSSDDLQGKRVAVQGLGSVGLNLVRHLTEAGAQVFGCDIHAPNVERAVADYGVVAVPSDKIMEIDCDILSPCALGGTLNRDTIPNLTAKLIAGAANNQLATPEDDDRLLDQGILYCPDFAINSGGIIEVYHQRLGTPSAVREEALANIAETLDGVLQRAREGNMPTQRAAIKIVDEMLAKVSTRTETSATSQLGAA
jgi:leucine dehydrogenase